MAGINFNDLPKNLQAKLQPFMTVGGAKTVEEAVAKAKEAKNWSPEDDKQFNALNGGANWGRTMDEYAFNSTKAQTYKDELPQAQRENQLAQARRKNNEEPSVWKKAGKIAGAGLVAAGTIGGVAVAAGAVAATLPDWAIAGTIGAGALLFSSCTNNLMFDDGIVPMKPYPAGLDKTEKLIEKITKYTSKYTSENNLPEERQKMCSELTEFLTKLLYIMDNYYEYEEQLRQVVDDFIGSFDQWLQDLENNTPSDVAISSEIQSWKDANLKNKKAIAGGEKIKRIVDFMEKLVKSIVESVPTENV